MRLIAVLSLMFLWRVGCGQSIVQLTGRGLYYCDSNGQTPAPQFSGLTFIGNNLYSIDNMDNGHYYNIEFTGDSCFFSTAINFQQPISDGDFEAISTDGKDIYILAEKSCIIYKIKNDAKGLCTITPYSLSLYEVLKNVGFFQSPQKNLRLESMAFINDTTFLVAPETAPRGLAMVTSAGLLLSYATIPDNPAVPYPATRPDHYRFKSIDGFNFKIEDGDYNTKDRDYDTKYSFDFSDVFVKDSLAYVLDRFKECIYIIDYLHQFSVKEIWSFQQVFIREDERGKRGLGTAEGIAIKDNCLYVICDNNDDLIPGAHILFELNMPH